MAVNIYATSAFMGYNANSGIFNDPQCLNATVQSLINHSVMIVGFNTSASGQDYWIMRNQWSTWWGDNGYFYFPRGLNYCNLLSVYVYAQ